MATTKSKTAFFCSECGNETPKWQGMCPFCKQWNTLTEQPKETPSATLAGKRDKPRRGEAKACAISEIGFLDEPRLLTGMDELDRVLGGGAVEGSLILVCGEPGIGKSTLLLQICGAFCVRGKVLYASGEESARQIKMRADRLKVASRDLYLLSETNIEDILHEVEQLKPSVLIVDSIQTMCVDGPTASPGSVTQVRESALALMRLAKENGVTVFIIGHVNKEGAIAGPKVLEHMVDCVLYFEGDRHLNYRVLRAMKNRFGSNSEIGLFEMAGNGLVEVPNPSAALLAGRPAGESGSCVACILEGTRPLLAEIQALVSRSPLGTPRRTVNGFDYNRALLLLAIIEKRMRVPLGGFDAYLNVVGGLRISEPSADLPAVLAILSSIRDKPVSPHIVAIGELGLSGELRAVSGAAQRVAEAYRLGFKVCLIPRQGSAGLLQPDGMELVRVKNMNEAAEYCL